MIHLRTQRQPAYALATILVLLGVVLFGVGAMVSISTLESKISRSQKEGISAYYAAEAGIQAGLWHLNNTAADSTALIQGSLDKTYSASDVPVAGQGFTVHMYTSPAKGAGYGIVEVNGYSNNGSFTANRKIMTNVFQGVLPSPTGDNGFFCGGSLSLTNGNSMIDIQAGNVYSALNMTVNAATINANGAFFNIAGTYNVGGGGVVNNLGGINYVTEITHPPGLDFNYYSNNNNQVYTGNQFTDLIDNAAEGETITIPGPVTFVDGSVNLTKSIAKDKILNITGMLIINGGLSVNASGFQINVEDPGNNKAGVFVASNLNNNNGAWHVEGVVYASGKITYTNTQENTINGGIIAGGDVNINVGLPMHLTYISARVASSFGAGAPLSVEVQHWEEEY